MQLERKKELLSELAEVMQGIFRKEIVMTGPDLNRHVDEGNTKDEEVMGKYGIKKRSKKGQMIVDFPKQWKELFWYLLFEEERAQSDDRSGMSSQINYVLHRRKHSKKIKDFKVMAEECAAKQH